MPSIAMTSTSSQGDKPTKDEKDKPFRLLDLPDEIWTKIIKMAVDGAPVFDTCRVCSQGHPRTEFPQPPMTRTCHTIRQETLSYFYSMKFEHDWRQTIYDHERGYLGKLFKMIGEQSRRALRCVRAWDISHYHKSEVENELRRYQGWIFRFQLEADGKFLWGRQLASTYSVKFL